MSNDTLTPAAARCYELAKDIKVLLGYSQDKSVLEAVKRDGLPAHKVGRRYLFDRAEVLEWIRQRDAGVGHRAEIKRLVDDAPELTAETADRIRDLLMGGAA